MKNADRFTLALSAEARQALIVCDFISMARPFLMHPLIKIILRWSVIEVIAQYFVARLIHPAAIYPASWVVYSLAGREAALRGKTWHGIMAGGAVAIIENMVWFVQGAPGHADTSDLPVGIAVLTYVTLTVGMAAIGAVFGAVGAAFGRGTRLRSEAEDGIRSVSLN